MEALIFVLALCAVTVVASLWGFDSRDTLRSKEQDLAVHGFRWDES